MHARAIIVAALSTITLVAAQDPNNSPSEFKIDAGSVDDGMKASWCNGQRAACTDICQSLKANDCDYDSLNYVCTCGNDESPDMNQYKDTIPFYVCQGAYDDCIQAHPDDALGQTNCTTSIQDKCATESAQNATQIGDTTSSAVSSSTPAPSNTEAVQTTSSSLAAAVPTNVQVLGNGAAVAAMAVFAYML